jgi:hypothetical protein
MNNSFKPFGLECGEGWRALYEPLAERCRAEGIEPKQVKEKLGQLRFYIGPGGSPGLYEAILAAEAASAEICEVCGEPSERSNGKGLTMTRCAVHRDAPATVGRLLPLRNL